MADWKIIFDQFFSPVIELVFLQICEHQDREAAMVILSLIFWLIKTYSTICTLQACLGSSPSSFAKYCPIISAPLVEGMQPYPLPAKHEKKGLRRGTVYGTLKASTVFMIVTDPPIGILFQEVVASFPWDESSNASHSTLNRGWQGTNNWSICAG